MTTAVSVSDPIAKPGASWLNASHRLWLVVAIVLPALILLGSLALPVEESTSVALAMVNLGILSVLALVWAVRAALVHRQSLPRLSATLWAALTGIGLWILSSTFDDLQAHELVRIDALVPVSIVLRVLGVGALILAAYQRWGAECAARLLGDFAYAIWDAARREEQEDLRLQWIGVLKLINEEVREPLAEGPPHALVLAEQIARVEQQIQEIEPPRALL